MTTAPFTAARGKENILDSASALSPCFVRVQNALRDFSRTATIDNASGLLGRFVAGLDHEPLRGFIERAVPMCDFQQWWLEQNGGHVFRSGKRSIDWPADTANRVALQVDACRKLVSKDIEFFNFVHERFNAGSSFNASLRKMGDDMLAPMLRDLELLSRERPVPAALLAGIRARPRSSDTVLDALVEEGCSAFLDPAPQSHRRAVERLWDAWERAKTLHEGKKHVAAEAMLDAVALPGSAFRELLGFEAKELTRIGNEFHIRHYETNRTPLDEPAQLDYFFHRMLAMLQLVVRSS